MARSSAAKKVAKAASTGGGGRDAQTERNLLFPMAVALVAVLGVVLIFVARDRRTENAPRGNPTIEDHWHSTYAIYACDALDPNVYQDDPTDQTGIHTHDDGLIHVHPFVSTVTGQFATLGAFFDEIQVEFDDETLELPSGDVLREGNFTCEGDDGPVDAEFRVLKWNSLSAETPIAENADLRDIRLNEDGQLFTFAWVDPALDDDEIPRPDDAFLREYLGLPPSERPISSEEGDVGPILPDADSGESGEGDSSDESGEGGDDTGDQSDDVGEDGVDEGTGDEDTGTDSTTTTDGS